LQKADCGFAKRNSQRGSAIINLFADFVIFSLRVAIGDCQAAIRILQSAMIGYSFSFTGMAVRPR
jgi:hypothetical protein